MLVVKAAVWDPQPSHPFSSQPWHTLPAHISATLALNLLLTYQIPFSYPAPPQTRRSSGQGLSLTTYLYSALHNGTSISGALSTITTLIKRTGVPSVATRTLCMSGPQQFPPVSFPFTRLLFLSQCPHSKHNPSGFKQSLFAPRSVKGNL